MSENVIQLCICAASRSVQTSAIEWWYECIDSYDSRGDMSLKTFECCSLGLWQSMQNAEGSAKLANRSVWLM